MRIEGMKPFLIAAALLIPSVVAQAQVSVVPPTPSAGEPFDIRVEGIWRDSCVPANPRLFVNNNELLITFRLGGGGGCLAVLTPWSASISTRLAAGTYQVRARVIDFDGPRPLFTAQIIVSGAAPGITSINPPFDTHAGNAVIRIRGSFPCTTSPCAAPAMLFGNRPADGVERISESEIHAVAPLQTDVTVVEVTVRGETYTHVRPSGFTYVSIEDYEKILVPIATHQPIPGAHDSLWQSELRMLNGSPSALEPGLDVLHFESRCSDCTTTVPRNSVLTPRFATPRLDSDVPPTFVIYAHKDVAPYFSFQLRVRDLSRQTETWGTEIPVVRGSDISSTLTLLDIPMRAGFRQMLRLYIPEYVACCQATVTFFSVDGKELATRDVRPQIPNGAIGGLVPAGYLREGSRELALQPAYAELDLQTVPELASQETIWLTARTSAQRLWGFVSVTNDATQHVTTITPQ